MWDALREGILELRAVSRLRCLVVYPIRSNGRSRSDHPVSAHREIVGPIVYLLTFGFVATGHIKRKQQLINER